MSIVVQMLLMGLATVSIMMFVLWLIGLRTHNFAIVDVGWTLGLPILATLYAAQGHGFITRSVLFVAMAWIWGLRLGLYLFLTRILGQPEEGRYQQLRKDWKTNINLKFLAFFEFQGVLDLVLSLPFLLASLNPTAHISVFEIIGAFLWAIAIIGESVADAQLTAFKRDSSSKGKTCQRGIWNYSRHPNYFFEWLVWVAWLIFALASPRGYLAIICPVMMFYFLFKVTGIPATEAQALRTKGDDYRRYQQTTSVFVPWFKKAPPAQS